MQDPAIGGGGLEALGAASLFPPSNPKDCQFFVYKL